MTALRMPRPIVDSHLVAQRQSLRRAFAGTKIIGVHVHTFGGKHKPFQFAYLGIR